MRNTPGTPTDSPPTTAVIRPIALPLARKRSSFAAAGAVSRPSNVLSALAFLSQWIRKAPPPMPEDCGSTWFNTSCTAMAASTALPPSFRIFAPTWAAMGFAATTM